MDKAAHGPNGRMNEAPAPRPRGRPASQTPQQKLEQLEREVVAMRERVREDKQRKLVIIGEAVAAEAETNAAFKSTLAEVISRRVTSAQGRVEIAALLLAQPVSKTGPRLPDNAPPPNGTQQETPE
jgi:hypothetical protein